MIGLVQNRLEFDYDIRSMIQAFYHGEKITADREQADLSVIVEYGKADVAISIWQDGRALAGKSAGLYPVEEASLEEEQKRSNRSETKKLLYRLLAEYTGRQLPWGTMTGVRPTKVGVEKLERGMNREKLEEFYKEYYLVSEKKAKLCSQVAQKEREVLSGIDYQKEYSLYVGIPFCPSRCLYCSFPSYPIGSCQNLVDAYLDALLREMDYVAHANKNRQLTAVYIGGGTPTSLHTGQLERLLEALERQFDLSHVREFTVEAGRPDSISHEKLQVMKGHPVTRISINPQTMNDETLKLIGRRHTSRDIVRVYQEARRMGFDNINMDVIIGLPGEELSHVRHTMEQLSALRPDSLTVHSLARKRASVLNLNYGQYQHLAGEDADRMQELTGAFAADMGLEPYYLYRQKNIAGNLENIGYSLPGQECLYNILIMEEKQDIIAIGAGASSKYLFPRENRLERVENVKNVEQYISRIEEMIERKKEVRHG